MNIYDFIKNFDSFLKECRANKLAKISINRLNFNFKKRISSSVQGLYVQLIKKISNNNLVVKISYDTNSYSGGFSVYTYLIKNIDEKTHKNVEYLEIPENFLNEIKTNKVFIDTLIERISENFNKWSKYDTDIDDEALNRFIKVVKNDFQTKMSAKSNNVQYQIQERKNKAAKDLENKKQIADFAKSLNIKQKWYLQSDIYRGQYAPATDDDYDGHVDDASFETVAKELCSTKEEVIKLSKAKVGTTITKIDEERRKKYTYIRKE